MIPDSARTVRLRTWGGGEGTFWQLGATIGVEWHRLPDWGPQATPGVRSRSWELPEATARLWFTLLASAPQEITYHKKETKPQ